MSPASLRGKKLAAALAAVEALLRDEAAAAAQAARPSIPSKDGPTAWGLSGRLASMNARMAGGMHRRS